MKKLYFCLFLALGLTGAGGFAAEESVSSAEKAKTSPTVTRLEKMLEKAPDNMKLREALAHHLMKEKNYTRVIEVLNPYTDLASPEAMLNLAGAYHQIDQFKDEIRVLNILLSKDDKNSELHFILGHAHLAYSQTLDPIQMTAEESTSISHFRKSLDLNPKYKPAYDALLDIFVANDNRYEARGIINDMIKAFGKRPELYNELCRLYSIDGFIEQAIQTCRQGIQISPRYPKNYVYLARAYRDQDEAEKAGKLLSNAAQRFPTSDFLQLAAGDFYQTQKNHPVATRYFRKAISINPKMPEAQIGLARSLTEQGNLKEAYPHYFEACKADHKTLPEFQEAAVKARQSGNTDLELLYSRGIYSCKQ